MAEKTNPLACKQCGYANEGERVYCHNCGTKLDRTLLPNLSEPEESLAKKQKRIRKIVMPNRGFFVGSGKAFVYTMLSALLVAGLILVALPPDGVPKPIGSDQLLDASPSMDLENATQQNAPVKLSFPLSEINTYLQSKLKAASSSIFGDSVKFQRIFVGLDENQIRITAEQDVFGRPIYSTIYYGLAIKNKKLEATVQGGNFGRLMVRPDLMKYIDVIFQNIWDENEIKQDKRLLDACQSIEVHKDHVDVVTQPEVQ